MKPEEFRRHAHDVVDWIADYLQNADRYPVMSRSRPGEIRDALPATPPAAGEGMDAILEDFRNTILPGVTHWNHPRFFAYFPANNSGPSILGEMLSAGLGVNAMLWQTSPAATELEAVVMAWLADLLQLPPGFHGVIQDTASTVTMGALMCARERLTDFASARTGLDGQGRLRVYTSREAHSSVLKGARLSGYGAENVVMVDIRPDRSLDPADLAARIAADREAGHRPCCIVATVGTTGSTAIDPLAEIGPIARREDLWLHVDAALAGTAAIVPRMRWILDGVEHADSLVFNPHKWLFTNFDCSASFVRDPLHLQRTMAIHPEYLKTARDSEVDNYMDWGVPLGRRFRALKLWFVLRSYGADRLREMVSTHLDLARGFADRIESDDRWELMAPVPLNTICFRRRTTAADRLDEANLELMARVNAEGTIYLTHTRLDGAVALRLAVGQTHTRAEHVEQAWDVLNREAEALESEAGS